MERPVDRADVRTDARDRSRAPRSNPGRRARLTMAGLTGLLGLTGLALVGCGAESGEASADRTAQALLDAVRDDYAGWPTMPGFEARQASASPHGNAVEIYINTVLDEALAAAIEAEGHDASGPWPVDSMVVKLGYDGDTLITRSLLHKTPDGWFYALFRADDAIVAAGREIHCLDCHVDGRDTLLSLDAVW